ncbi:MAG TPA: DUF1579 family protein [Candidatus Dormibacteraeota bacterium]|nr:DUF1579 family protein [Candidatus Dormibacteraeota bacterium]
MVKRLTTFAIVAVLAGLGALGGFPQAPSAPPKPGAEQEKLAFFVGRWNSQADLKASAFGPGGKYSGTETCEWVANRFGILCRTQGTLPMGPITGVSMIGYDAGEKTYVYSEINNFGETSISRGTVDGDTWTWTNDAKMAGKLMHQHFTMKVVSPDAATYKFEMAEGDGPFNMVMEGKQTRLTAGKPTRKN